MWAGAVINENEDLRVTCKFGDLQVSATCPSSISSSPLTVKPPFFGQDSITAA